MEQGKKCREVVEREAQAEIRTAAYLNTQGSDFRAARLRRKVF
jgi:hypothetical protein